MADAVLCALELILILFFSGLVGGNGPLIVLDALTDGNDLLPKLVDFLGVVIANNCDFLLPMGYLHSRRFFNFPDPQREILLPFAQLVLKEQSLPFNFLDVDL